MVKRAIAMTAGALAGTLLWFAADALFGAPQADPRTHACPRENGVECVRMDAPPVAAPKDRMTVADACKAWLGASGADGLAKLSQCLHDARRRHDAALVDAAHRKQALATSS